ncbi:MAG: hypothetical protein EOM30_11145 [Clostridia bacterium]|jgi:uncharacterized membrane protein|nr:hypothetical protein [Clostridia bacterium]NLS86123.1 hypothetical protein [Oscillospiraceae bacterium]
MSFLNATIAGFSLYQLFWYFSIYALLGWCMEVCFDTVRTGKFVNRGFLNGPVCPIYGFGMVIVILVLTPMTDNLLMLYLGTVLLASALELVTGWVLKKIFHTTWWDYSDVPFNLGGYICLKFSLLWGVGGVFVMDIVQPLIASFVDGFPRLGGEILFWIILVLFVSDAIVTIVAMAKLNAELGTLNKIAEALRKGSDAMAKNLGDTALNVDSRFDEAKAATADKLEAAKDEANERLDAVQDRFDAAKKEAMQALDTARGEWTRGSHLVRRRLLRAFPNAKHNDYDEALTKIKQYIKNLKTKEDDNDENDAT